MRNNQDSIYVAKARVALYNPSTIQAGAWACSLSGLAKNSWSVCFGEALTKSGSVYAGGSANASGFGLSPDV
ncbi:hypothetical protein HNR57_007749 [Streptomyces paradoxus]|uniref:Uncharacterized protein n=1 Tax=Streptomyces paradoxus TaxID=66375 RepID=A0A7W9WLJ2_9ACTN|nr:hypothetical protein [Streptomyces paradoxus]